MEATSQALLAVVVKYVVRLETTRAMILGGKATSTLHGSQNTNEESMNLGMASDSSRETTICHFAGAAMNRLPLPNAKITLVGTLNRNDPTSKHAWKSPAAPY